MQGQIAIVGMGCRYPQASSVASLWQLLTSSGDAIANYVGPRFAELDAFYANSEQHPGKVAIHRGGFLTGVDAFDAPFFEMAPREAMYMDPQHRLLLEVAWEALEDAGQTREEYRGSRTGVYIGLWNSEYEQYLYKSSTALDFYALSGGGHAPASGRLSYTFGLEGPGLTVDTACSSSLVAVHLACKSLLSGETNMALAGGSNLIFDTAASELFMQANMLSPDGYCKFGDASANGFVRSEGAGVIVLKRLPDAIAAGDRVYAVIRGTAVNNDGRSNGLMMTPSVEGQQEMLRQAWEAADISPSRLRYIEAHGTGTGVGDPVEIEAIGNALKDAGVTTPCLLGSIKTNIGHTESASGVAGLIKVALSLHHQTLPPSLHFQSPNPKIAWDRLPVRINIETRSLADAAEPVIAGVNSFGLTGTNAHIVLEEFRQPLAKDNEPAGPCIFAASGHVVESMTGRLSGAIKAVGDATANAATLYQLCRTAAMRRTHFDHRAIVVANSLNDLSAKLTATLAGDPVEGLVMGRARQGKQRVVFILPGQGSQWAGMARELYSAEPIFCDEFDRCSRAVEAETGWSLVDRVLGPSVKESLAEIDVVQPALFAIGVSLAALWKSWGIVPDAVIGHSMGEVAAACIAGALSLTDASAVICRRSRLMKSIRGQGAMATIELPASDVEERLALHSGVSIAASNSPTTTVVAGDADAVDALLAELERDEVFCRRVKVDVASHSSQVDPILGSLHAELVHLAPRSTTTPLYSTVLGKFISGSEMDADYWVRNLRQPVLFSPAISALANDGHSIFIEMSPHPVLVAATEATLRAESIEATVVPSLRREKPERVELLSSFGSLFVSGYPVDWSRLFAVEAPQVDFPVYTFQRERCWPAPETLNKAGNSVRFGSRSVPLLGRRFVSSQQPGTVLFDVDLDLARLAYLQDHKVRGSVVLPAAAHMEIALEAAQAIAPNSNYSLRQVVLEAAITLDESQPQDFQIALTPHGEGVYAFEIRGSATDTNADWTLFSHGMLDVRAAMASEAPLLPIASLIAGAKHHTAAEHYSAMARRGIDYGPAFQLFAEAWTSGSGTLVRVSTNKSAGGSQQGYVFHPALLDGCLQAISQVFPMAGSEDESATYLPVGVGKLSLYDTVAAEDELFVLANAVRVDETAGAFVLDLHIANASGKIFATISELKAQKVRSAKGSETFDLLFSYDWKKSDTGMPALPKTPGIHLLIFADRSGVADALQQITIRQGGRCTLVYPGANYAEVRPEAIYEIDPLQREHLDRLLGAIGAHPPSAVVHLWSLARKSADPLTARSLRLAQDIGAYQLPLLVQAVTQANLPIPPRLWMVTQGVVEIGGQAGVPEVAAAPLWGAGTAIASEHPELKPCLVDLAPDAGVEDIDHLAAVILVARESEDRIALRQQARYVPRFTRYNSSATLPATELLKADQEYRVEIREPGILDNLSLRAFERRLPGPGEVAIEITAAGLNFIDVAKAMGIYPGLDPNIAVQLGGECAGRVVAVGEGVTGLAVGEEVAAITSNATTNGLLSSYAVLPSELVVPKPPSLSIEQAASLPIAYLTAYHSLVKLAHIAANEWVLIHAGAGGVGIAAIEIAHRAGARVIATASSPDKHAYLKSLGVQHLLQSRTTDFAREALEITGGRGVDIVLNSLSGEFITKSLETLAPYGRFIELGKRDIYQDRRVGLKAFRNNISYHVVDIAAAMVEQRHYVAELMSEVMGQLASGNWKPLPLTIFPAAEPSSGNASEAFRFMAQARHIGKVVLSFGRNVQVLPAERTQLFRNNASYIITGALGGVGSAAASWMAANGAGHLVLMSRRKPSAESEALMREIEQQGTRVVHVQTDVADPVQVEALTREMRRTMPPLRGILHAAAAIDDCLALNLTHERFETAMDAKAFGAWNLHAATLAEPLDFFVLFSSVAAVYPAVGVASYAAANTFLDTFARYRRALGRPATSVNWGGWDKTGLAREAGTVRSIDSYNLQGILNFSPQEGLACLGEAIKSAPVQVAVFRFNIEEFQSFHAENGVPPIFSALITSEAAGSPTATQQSAILSDLTAAPSSRKRKDILERYLQEQLGNVLKLSVDRIDRERALGTMGLDSLMALEFIRRTNAGLGTALPATAAFNHPTIRQLAAHILHKLNFDEIADSATTVEQTPTPSPKANAILTDGFSDEEAMRALMDPDGAARER